MKENESQVIVSLEHIYKSFQGVKALEDLNLEIQSGEVFCLAGENGSGKSTLIKIISGVYTPDSGDVKILGHGFNNLKHLKPIEAINFGVQVIYQDFALFPNLTVYENISANRDISTHPLCVNKKSQFSFAQKALSRIEVDIDLDELVENLPVADKQLVAIARVLMFKNTKLLILDEPTTALTHKEVKRLLDVILMLKNEGISVLFVSHKLRELLEVSDRIAIMRNGRKVSEGQASDYDEKIISKHMIGKEISHNAFVSSFKSQEEILRVENISHKDDYRDISFSVYRGDVLGITGLLGCGKSEIALSLFGELPIQSGKIFVEGNQVELHSISNSISNGIGYVPEDRLTEGLFMDKPILNNVLSSSFNLFTQKFGIIDFDRAKSSVQKKIQELKLNTNNLEMEVRNLSGGNQQRVVIAKWLCTPTKILVLNGPTVGVDIGSKFEIHQKLKDMANSGLAVIIISDDLPELLENCNRILLIDKGQLVNEFLNTINSEKDILATISDIM